jgi:hypothetical protein
MHIDRVRSRSGLAIPQIRPIPSTPTEGRAHWSHPRRTTRAYVDHPQVHAVRLGRRSRYAAPIAGALARWYYPRLRCASISIVDNGSANKRSSAATPTPAPTRISFTITGAASIPVLRAARPRTTYGTTRGCADGPILAWVPTLSEALSQDRELYSPA